MSSDEQRIRELERLLEILLRRMDQLEERATKAEQSGWAKGGS